MMSLLPDVNTPPLVGMFTFLSYIAVIIRLLAYLYILSLLPVHILYQDNSVFFALFYLSLRLVSW